MARPTAIPASQVDRNIIPRLKTCAGGGLPAIQMGAPDQGGSRTRGGPDADDADPSNGSHTRRMLSASRTGAATRDTTGQDGSPPRTRSRPRAPNA